VYESGDATTRIPSLHSYCFSEKLNVTPNDVQYHKNQAFDISPKHFQSQTPPLQVGGTRTSDFFHVAREQHASPKSPIVSCRTNHCINS
jgi:hypothetical protein